MIDLYHRRNDFSFIESDRHFLHRIKIKSILQLVILMSLKYSHNGVKTSVYRLHNSDNFFFSLVILQREKKVNLPIDKMT